ncbi:MAG: class I SAM-dependent methyltransferase [Alphaproteobacteria bacterium]|nr:class I SAM-dependent methyltransferase [Alphaproteobacteria bacterium]
MTAALADPEEGYYRRRDPLGAAGDFVTAPEVSQMFGELIGAWAAITWQQMGRPDPVRLVEIGPGRGTLMADALRATARVEGFHPALRLHLVEIGERLMERQRATLGKWNPTWHPELSDVPEGPAIVIANEFLDTLPIRQLVRSGSGWEELMVGLQGDELAYVFGPTALAPLVPPILESALPGTTVEVSPARIAVADLLARRILAHGGAALLIDYGPPESRAGGTFQAIRSHQKWPPLAEPGTADITSHVDFGELVRAARLAGAATYGPIGQGEFLERLGIRPRAERLSARDAGVAEALGRLIDLDEMGTLFQVIVIAHPDLPAPAGFES